MNWIDKLERRYGNLGIPNLINGLLIGQLAAGIIMLFFNRDFGSLLMLSRTYVLHGQIWRLITFLFQPVWLGGALGDLAAYDAETLEKKGQIDLPGNASMSLASVRLFTRED